MNRRAIIFGAGAHASVVADILRQRGEFEVAGFLDDVSPNRKGELFCGLPVLGGREELDRLRKEGIGHAIVGFGKSQSRLETARLLTNKGFQLVTGVHPAASVGIGAAIGEGTVIKGGATIDPGVNIGRHVIIGAGVTVAHGAVIADGVRIAAGADIGANVTLEKGAFIGLSASIRNGSIVGAFALVGAGSLVLGHVPEGMVAFGVPARTIRAVADDDL